MTEPLPVGSCIEWIGFPTNAVRGTYLGDGWWLDLRNSQVFFNPVLAPYVVESLPRKTVKVL